MKIGTYLCGWRWIENIRKLTDSTGVHEVNCWVPGNQQTHLEEGSLFLLRLNPDGKKLVGGGIFHHSEKNMTYEKAWNLYGKANGAHSQRELREMAKNAKSYNPNFIASQVITRPFFLDEEDWIDFPEGPAQKPLRYLDLEQYINRKIWKFFIEKSDYSDSTKILRKHKRVGVIQNRYGQSEFRKKVLELFGNKCAVSGETITDVIEACHIKPHACENSYDISNGIPLRADLHKLFDSGHATIRNLDGIYEFVIGDQVWKDFDGGQSYRKWHKKKIRRPSGWNIRNASLIWHHRKYKKFLGDVNKL